jgi:lipopolysaccharide/colanic/teichoic acid biosynthesis glycosyltransferase
MRRVFDLICATTGLVLLSPLFAVVALAIKREDGGAVLFAQPRVGKDFRKFRVLKFRSMVPGADHLTPLTVPGDARVTRVGRVLRKYKLDELPQLVNVVRGEMQMVGARPEIERYVQMFLLQYAEILRDRPGITDPATLAYRREEEAFSAGDVEAQYVTSILPRKLELSLEHARCRTFLSDLGIIIRTLLSLHAAPRGTRPAPETEGGQAST